MANFCYTGPRKISYEQGIKIEKKLAEGLGESWHVGDATGADTVIRRYLESCGLLVKLYRSEGKEPWQLAQRSKRMVDECWKLGGAKLIAFPNKPCPDGVKPARNFGGKGSGTWGTVAYAYWLGMDVELIFLEENLAEPDWMGQLSLF